MLKTPMKLATASLLLATTVSVAGAAPSTILQFAHGVEGDLVRVHGLHRSCERGPGGWHRHNRYGERRHCREWRGGGRRPDYCVRVGPVYYCDY
jgi:hypothetical protein